jgi:ABC-type lipoprotein release transport system permease subunit
MNRTLAKADRRLLMPIMLGAIAVAFTVFALFGSLSGEASEKSQSLSAEQVIKISARDGSLSQQALDKIEALNNIADVRALLVVSQGETRVMGVDPSRGFLVEADGALVKPKVVEGRLLKASDAGKDVIVVGKRFAQTHKTGFGYPILGMADHRPPFFLGDQQVTILGVYESGGQADQWALLPLGTAQRLYGKPAQVNEAYIVLDDPAKRSSTVDAIRRIVGDDVRVQALAE